MEKSLDQSPNLIQESIPEPQNPIGDEFDAFVNFENSCEFSTLWQNVTHGPSAHLTELEAPSGFNIDQDALSTPNVRSQETNDSKMWNRTHLSPDSSWSSCGISEQN